MSGVILGKQARIEADKLRILLEQGINPSEKRLQERIARREHMANTFGDAANAWFEFRSNPIASQDH